MTERRSQVPSWAAAGLALAFATQPCRAEYLLEAGDVVEVAVAGQPELRHRAPVQLDGMISVPMLGAIRAAGSTPAAVQERLALAFGTRIFRQRTPDGRDKVALIQPGDVSASVVEYRPVYVNGDVLNPGQHAYRPQMTARHAIALSGGVSTVRGRAATAGTEVVEAERDKQTTAMTLAKEHVRAWRLAAELDSSDSIKPQPLPPLVTAAALAEMIRVETRFVQVRLAELRQEKAHLEAMASQASDHIKTLTQQEQQEERGLQADIDELDRVTKLYGTGNLPSTRVSDSRRAVLLSSTRRLQTAANLTQVKQQRDELLWRAARVDVIRRIDVLREVSESQIRLAELSTRLESAVEKLRVLGRMITLEPAGRMARPSITIVRRDRDRWTQLPASEDDALRPGDTIEVVFRTDLATSAAVQ